MSLRERSLVCEKYNVAENVLFEESDYVFDTVVPLGFQQCSNSPICLSHRVPDRFMHKKFRIEYNAKQLKDFTERASFAQHMETFFARVKGYRICRPPPV